MTGLNDKEKKILKFLYTIKTSFPINQIATGTELSWETVSSYLEKLENDGYVVREERIGKEMFKFNFERYDELRKELR